MLVKSKLSFFFINFKYVYILILVQIEKNECSKLTFNNWRFWSFSLNALNLSFSIFISEIERFKVHCTFWGSHLLFNWADGVAWRLIEQVRVWGQGSIINENYWSLTINKYPVWQSEILMGFFGMERSWKPH